MQAFTPKLIMRLTNIGLHLAAFILVIAFGSYGVAELMLIVICLTVAWAAGHFALKSAGSRRNNGLGLLTLGLVILFWIAYTSKLGLAMVIADKFWVVPNLLSEEALLAILPDAFLMATVGYVAILAAVLSFPLRHRIDWQLRPCLPRYRLMLVLVCFGLILKYILKAYFSLGVPGLDPVQLVIPNLSGVLSLLLDFGFLFFANVPFFLALLSARRWYLAIAFLAAMANAVIDLSFGSKDTIMYQMVMISSYLLIFGRGLSWGRNRFRRTARNMLIVLAIVGASVLGAYKYMNFYRYAILSDVSDITEAVQVAALSDVAQSRSSFVQLYNRITGLEALSAAMYLDKNFSSSTDLLSMLNGSVVERFTEIIMSGQESKTGFGLTIFGYWYIYGGAASVFIAMLLVGFLLALIQYFVVRGISVPHNMKLAFLPVLWILFVWLMFGGTLTIWIKQLIVTLVAFFVVGRIATVQKGRHPSRQLVKQSTSIP